MDKDEKRRFMIIAGTVALVAALHYLTPLRQPFFYELFSRLFYVPIFLGAFWFGLRGGIAVSALVAFMYLPHVVLGWGSDKGLFYDQLLEVVLFSIAGPVVGALTDREHRQRARIQELQILAALGEAASSIAHEMKNMVIPVRGFLRRIRESSNLDGKASGYLEIVERESARIEEMTKDMLAFARQASPRKEDVDVGLLVEDVKEMMHEEFRRKGVQLACRCDGGLPQAVLDRERIRQALLNLLQNALHASAEGSEVRLIAHSTGAENGLQFIVEDDGMGIAREDLDRVFLPFFTTKPAGTGLGLAITQRIIEEHGGKIWIEASPGKGTRVNVEIPIP
jgi:two-component system, NtrC family, sensor histidine kinase HydH